MKVFFLGKIDRDDASKIFYFQLWLKLQFVKLKIKCQSAEICIFFMGSPIKFLKKFKNIFLTLAMSNTAVFNFVSNFNAKMTFILIVLLK